MLEDDIQYMGMKIASNAHAGRPFTPSNPVTGIVLHVEANGGQPPFDLRFLRSLTSAVTIGRKSTSDHKSAPGEPSIAGFTCQVVSGKHAKLAFSDSGFVYIIDLGSRHGTHVRRPGETVSRTLDPEIVTMLNSGDYITFGKTVGKGSQLVPPITARIQFLYGSEPEIYEVPSKTPSPFGEVSPEPSRARKTSGRYGLYAPSSFSSPEHSSDEDSFSSKYDHDSDIEEIPAHEVIHTTVYSATSALRALQAHIQATSYEPTPLRSAMSNNLPSFVPSRSHSPMDLSSPTPSPVGAYPLDLEPEYQASPEQESSFNRSSAASSDGEAEKEASEAEHEEGEVRDEQSPEAADPLFSNAVTPSPLSRAASANLDEDQGRPSLMNYAPDFSLAVESRSPSPPSEFDFQGQVKAKELASAEAMQASVEEMDIMSAKINDSIERIGRELREAAATNDKWNADNAASLNAALNGLPGPTDVGEWAASVLDKASAAASSSLPATDFEPPVVNQQDAIATTMIRDEAAETLAEVKASVAAMTVLVSELKTFHENMEKQMSEKLASIESARAELAAATTAAGNENQLKRKRDDSVELELAELDLETGPVTMDVCCTKEDSLSVEARPKKKLRRFASSVMHTATAATVGAVATWAALAFS